VTVSIIDFLVEEPSTEAFLRLVLPGILGDTNFNVYPFQGKQQLLAQLPNRLRGYSRWISDTHRIVVVVDRDDDDCYHLKQQLEKMAENAGLFTRSRPNGDHFTVINRITIEELEAWYFGDWEAVRSAYPKVPTTIPKQAPYRNVDAITGGTWERFEGILQRAGYFKSGLRKIEVAQTIAPYIVSQRNTSTSFQVFRNALLQLLQTDIGCPGGEMSQNSE
jgi:Txe/YoeB family toxin of Txe-Axe toxin-antitoxin module